MFIVETDKQLTIVIILFFICAFVITQLSLRYVTNVAREHNLVTPLPDIYHKVLPIEMRKYHEYSDWMPILPLVVFILIDKFQHAGELLFLLSLVYIIRAISFTLTVLPSPAVDCKCEWEHEPETFMRRILNLFYQEGCNDLIFSGHTSMMVMSSLFLCWYIFPGNYAKIFGIIIYNIIGVLVIIGTRLHYSVDTFIATIICTLLFFAFHPMQLNKG